ncbi:hypothetical protein JNB84_22530 [Rhizobium pusense]|uniref:hypothetical protein n=1 Tax=Agrobacterium pusense TaxID=648995 RepID=UPI001C6EF5DA|nr:hypothetical protein [Agrobacterium pusense]MBW9080742.1 hypothetical protein [Agrobacterium pusense]
MAECSVARLPVLVCLSNPRAIVLVNEMLTREGFSVTSVRNLPQFEDASRAGGYSVIVTTDEVIDMIRRITLLPVVNIRSFIHVWSVEGTGKSSSLFDRAAFISRVRLAAENFPPVPLVAG